MRECFFWICKFTRPALWLIGTFVLGSASLEFLKAEHYWLGAFELFVMFMFAINCMFSLYELAMWDAVDFFITLKETK